MPISSQPKSLQSSLWTVDAMELLPEADAPVIAMIIQDESDIERPQKRKVKINGIIKKNQFKFIFLFYLNFLFVGNFMATEQKEITDPCAKYNE